MQDLVETRKEYIELLQDFISIPLSQRIYNIYTENNKRGKNVLQEFQKELELIPKWNNHIIETETQNIIEKSGCNYLHKLLKLTISSGIKIKFREYGHNMRKLKMKMPTLEDFIHKCFINSASFCWKHAYLFTTSKLNSVQIQNNINTIENNIRKMVSKSLRHCINGKELIEELESLSDRSFRKKSNSHIQKTHYTNKHVNHDNVIDDKSDDVIDDKSDDIIDDKSDDKSDDVIDDKSDDIIDDKSDEDKLDEDKSDEDKSNDDKSDENKSDEDKSDKDKLDDDKSDEDKSGDDKLDDDKSDEDKSDDDKSDDDKLDDNKSGDDKLDEDDSDDFDDIIDDEIKDDKSNAFKSEDETSSEENEDIKVVNIDDMNKSQYFKKKGNLFF